MIARITVQRGGTTEYPLAERTNGGWQNGVMFYADETVTAVQELEVHLLGLTLTDRYSSSTQGQTS